MLNGNNGTMTMFGTTNTPPSESAEPDDARMLEAMTRAATAVRAAAWATALRKNVSDADAFQ
jgi:hypothetical protein